ncbi:MAG: hypothetical protein K8T10_18190 [Candidatus Eremiobacteraeota bacterium]|nr:hypothetical protein [Candidatus Eremiobacteraeota bacterium]
MSTETVFNGSQFLFIKPGKKACKVVLEKDGEKRNVLIDKPTVLSKYKTQIAVKGSTHFKEFSLNMLKLSALVTDRKVYKPGDAVEIFAFLPQYSGRKVKFEIHRNDKVFTKEEIEIDDAGMFRDKLKDLNDGAYALKVFMEEKEIADCEFTVAEYSLSFMRASLVSHTYKDQNLSFSLSILMGDIPYDGELNAGLFCGFCEIVVASIKIQSEKGNANGEFSLAGHTGPFTIVITTPDGESATVFLPGTKSDVRDTVRISQAGEIIEGGLLPSDSLPQKVRGIYYGSVGVQTMPVTLENMAGKPTVLHVNQDIDHLLLNIYSPLDDKFWEIEKRNVRKDEKLDLDIPYPISILTIGAIGRDCYETYSLLFNPENMDLDIEADEKVKPGEEIDILVKSNRSGKLMLVVADSRLERENPLDKLAENTFRNIKLNIAKFHSGKVEEYSPVVRGPQLDTRYMFAGMGGAPDIIESDMGMMAFASASMDLAETMTLPLSMDVDEFVDSQADEVEEESNITTTRMDFPELLFADIIEFDGRFEKKLKLGEQIGAFTIFAFLIDGFDFKSAKKQVQTSQDVYVELDVPALLSPGDEIMGKVYAKCPDEGKLSVRSALTSIEEEINKIGKFEILLKSAGEVMAELDSPMGKDITSKTILPPGKEKITTSNLVWLKPEESVRAEKIVVYPDVGFFIKDATKSLVKYPFGCAEQTSAKLYGLALVYKAIKNNSITNGNRDVKRFLYQGADRMKLFFRGGKFSLWEHGTPETYVTIQVLSNLRAIWKMGIENVDEMISEAVNSLKNEKIKDNGLVIYNGDFAGKMKTLKDAVCFYRRGIEVEKAIKMIREKVIVKGNIAYWEDSACWSGKTEATCLALQVAQKEDQALFEKGFRFISSKLQDGRLYSTSDTCAFLEMMNSLEKSPANKVILDGNEVKLDTVMTGREVTAIEEILVRIDGEKEVDYLSPRSDFDGEVKIERTSLKTGEKTSLSIIPKEESIAPLTRIYLPGNVACLQSGAGIQKLYLPIKEKSLNLEIYGIRKGRGKLRVVLHDMYNEEKVGVLPGLSINVH